MEKGIDIVRHYETSSKSEFGSLPRTKSEWMARFNFPLYHWLEIVKWLERVTVQEQIYFLAMTARDMGLTRHEIKMLKDKNILFWQFEFGYILQLGAIFRRLFHSDYLTDMGLVMFKREFSRLGVTVKEIDFGYSRINPDQQSNYAFVDLASQVGQNKPFQEVKVWDGDKLSPIDKQMLQKKFWIKFPIQHWDEIKNWAMELSVAREFRIEIIYFFHFVGHQFASIRFDKFKAQLLILYSSRIYDRVFVNAKNHREFSRRLDNNLMLKQNLQTLRMFSYFNIQHFDFLTYLWEKFHNRGSHFVIDLRKWSKAYCWTLDQLKEFERDIEDKYFYHRGIKNEKIYKDINKYFKTSDVDVVSTRYLDPSDLESFIKRVSGAD